MPTPQDQSNNPLHGITLEKMLTELHQKFGWEKLAYFIPINCFTLDIFFALKKLKGRAFLGLVEC